MNREQLEHELDYLVKGSDCMQKSMNNDILKIFDAFEKVGDEGGHSGFSFSYLKGMVQKLIIDDGLIRPILSIKEDPDDWNESQPIRPEIDKGIVKIFQNKRRCNVFGHLYEDGTELYMDVDKARMTDCDGKVWYNSSGCRQFETIAVPYIPDGKKWYIYTKPTIELEPGYSADEDAYVITKVEYR